MENHDINTLNTLSEKISRLYDALNEDRTSQLADIRCVKDYIYRTSGNLNNFRLPDIYEQAQTLKAHLLDSLSSHPEGLFEVFPKDLKFSENAQKQKAMLVSAFENMKLADKLENIVNDMEVKDLIG